MSVKSVNCRAYCGHTYHTGLSNRVGEQDQDDAEHGADLDVQTAWMTLKKAQNNSVDARV